MSRRLAQTVAPVLAAAALSARDLPDGASPALAAQLSAVGSPSSGRWVLLVVFPIIACFCLVALGLLCAQLVRHHRRNRELTYLLGLATMHGLHLDTVTLAQHQQPHQQPQQPPPPGSTFNALPALDSYTTAAVVAALEAGNPRGAREVLRRLWLQHLMLEQQGPLLSSWEDVRLAWTVWSSEEDGATRPASQPGARSKQFPGLAPWLIADLPTWTHAGAPRSSVDADDTRAPSDAGAAPQHHHHEHQQQAEAEAAAAAVSSGAGPSSAGGSSQPGGSAAGAGLHAVPPFVPAAPLEGTGKGEEVDGAACAICLDHFAPGDVLAGLPRCRHCFHQTCLTSWLRQSATCPNCRTVVLPDACE